MVLWLLQLFSNHHHVLRVFQYLTFRSLLAALTALLVVLLWSPRFIKRLTALNVCQVIRDDGPKEHFKKAGTPTMGGVLIVFSLLLSVLLWSHLSDHFIWLLTAVTVSTAVVGVVDDYLKLKRGTSGGLPAKWKYLWLSLIGLSSAIVLYYSASTAAETALLIPFFKNQSIPLGWLYIVLVYFVIVGSANAVNLTDGLDGLALMPTVMVGAALGVFAYVTGNSVFAHYLQIPYVAGVGEVSVFCSALVGSGLGFLWYNTYPAAVFMGDVGSVSIGAALGLIAVLVRQELVFFIMAGVFVAETNFL